MHHPSQPGTNPQYNSLQIDEQSHIYVHTTKAIVTQASIHVKHVLVFSSPWEQAKSRILVCILTISKYTIPTIYKQHNIKQENGRTVRLCPFL
jgi:hypothetical protein